MLLYVISIIVYIIAVSISYINEYCPMWVNIPEYISIINSVIILGINILIWIRKKGKPANRVVNSILAMIAIVICFYGTYCNPYWNSIIFKDPKDLTTKGLNEVVSYNEAMEDVNYAMKYLKKIHPALRIDVPKKITDQYYRVKKILKTDEVIRVEELQTCIESIYTIMNDEHTIVCKGDITTAKTYNSNKIEDNSFIRYNIDVERKIAFFTLDKCVYNDYYKKYVKDMFRKVKEHNIQNIIVDLRNNGGGNSKVANEFIRYLDIDKYKTGISQRRKGIFVITEGDEEYKNHKYADMLFKGNVYVLTSNNTFSSAMTFTELIKENDLGLVIGEPPSNSPNCYIDCSVFMTPNAKIQLRISTKQSFAINQDSTDELIQPDIKCNADNALEVLLQRLP